MFPNVENVAFFNQHEEHSDWIGLQERVISWLHGIRDPEPCPASPFTHRSKDRKRHHYSPYPTRCELPPAHSLALSHKTQFEATLESEFPMSASEASPIWHVQENIDQVECRTTSLIEFKVADDLPDPEYNPLVSFNDRKSGIEYLFILLVIDHIFRNRHRGRIPPITLSLQQTRSR